MRIVVFMNVSLDGVIQAPGRPDEDVRGGFKHGGWSGPYADPAMGKAVGESMSRTGGILLGRRTYEDFYAVWPKRVDNPFTEVLSNSSKYVVSRTLEEPLPWMNSTLLKGEASKTVAELKQRPGKDVVVLGSGELVDSLTRCNLVDEYMLLIHPLILGSGRRLFSDRSPFETLHLLDSRTTTTGVVITRYQPNGEQAR